MFFSLWTFFGDQGRPPEVVRFPFGDIQLLEAFVATLPPFMVVVGKHVFHFCLLWFSGKSPLNC